MKGLKEATGYIKGQIARKINLRVTPDLQFEIDDSMEYGEKIDKLLNEMNKKENKDEE